MWPGIVGKGDVGSEPYIALSRMLELTQQARSNDQGFDGVDSFV